MGEGESFLDDPIRRRLIYGLGGLVLVLAVGTAGYMLIEGWSLLDALYMSVTAVTTVGFQEVRPLSSTGRVFTIGFVLIGVGVAFYILTSSVAAIIEGDLTQLYGARRLRMTIDRLRDHYIICGYGRVGVEVARELRTRDESFVVVDHNEEALARARTDNVLWISGDATTEQALQAAGIERCHGIVAASDSDAGNIYITLTAKALRPDVFVVARVGSPAVATKLRQAGANRIISPYSLGGRRMALAALQPIISDFIDLVADGAQGDRILAEVNVDAASGLAGRQLAEALSRARDVVALALTDPEGKLTVGPPGATVLNPGDRLTLVGSEEELRSVGAVRAR